MASKAVQEWQEYRVVQRGEDGETWKDKENSEVEVKWKPPTNGFIMLNIDATLDKKQEKAGWGIVTRNEHGEAVCT